VLRVISFDLDGTLIRKGYDDIFWNELIPQHFAESKKISFEDAQKFILDAYNSIGPSDPRWYIPEYWFERFGLTANIREVLKKVNYAEGVYDDLHMLSDFSRNHTVIISTNNPRTILEHKLEALNHAKHFLRKTFSSVSDFDNIVKSKEFYLCICREMAVKPEEMLHIGDDLTNDVEVPLSVGVNALLIDRERNDDGKHVIHSLAELKRVL
jgi:putative hydrolase of the HAD superfamily